MQTLTEYINANHGGNKSAFGRSIGASRQQVNQWINAGLMVHGTTLVAIRKELK